MSRKSENAKKVLDYMLKHGEEIRALSKKRGQTEWSSIIAKELDLWRGTAAVVQILVQLRNREGEYFSICNEILKNTRDFGIDKAVELAGMMHIPVHHDWEVLESVTGHLLKNIDDFEKRYKGAGDRKDFENEVKDYVTGISIEILRENFKSILSLGKPNHKSPQLLEEKFKENPLGMLRVQALVFRVEGGINNTMLNLCRRGFWYVLTKVPLNSMYKGIAIGYVYGAITEKGMIHIPGDIDFLKNALKKAKSYKTDEETVYHAITMLIINGNLRIAGKK